jgi:hypothetical protein
MQSIELHALMTVMLQLPPMFTFVFTQSSHVLPGVGHPPVPESAAAASLPASPDPPLEQKSPAQVLWHAPELPHTQPCMAAMSVVAPLGYMF